ncbi:MAG: MFS transporter [Bacteroidaceae bacterium]|nr:MFS transporter [Bacteroidaceae bacterium]
MYLKLKLSVLNFLELAVWGAYLISMGTYLASVGMANQIGYFYAVQGFVSLFMPTLMGIVADRWVQAQRLFALCHFLAGGFMLAVCYYAMTAGEGVEFVTLFTLYALSIAFYMPTISLSYSVSYNALEKCGLDTVKSFPPIRVWGTVGFIISMWIVDLTGWQCSPLQFAWSAVLSLLLAAYALTMPACEIKQCASKSMVDALGLRAFTLMKDYRMAVFFTFSFLLGVCLQITNGYANPFISSFGEIEQYADTFGVRHANILISLSQVSETLCILLIPFFLKRFGIKYVMLMSMMAWCLRFGLFAIGDPGSGVVWFILSMIVYGVAFDFFNISGSLFVNKTTDPSIRSSAQGLLMMMSNGLGSMIGLVAAQSIFDHYVFDLPDATPAEQVIGGWQTCWFIFSAYALVLAVFFTFMFKYKHTED